MGFEPCPRVGLALNGLDVFQRGWHSGCVFGPAAEAAATSNLMALPAGSIEDALGSACTQAGGLTSAQFGGMAKHMWHGFAARNGLLVSLTACKGYTELKGSLTCHMEVFLSSFALEPPHVPERIVSQLGQIWELVNIVIKP